MKKIFFFTFLLLCFLLLPYSYAQVPRLINYQGKLTDTSGNPVADGNYSITLRIYDADAGGNLLWEETQSILVQKGIFSCLLGGVTNLDLAFDRPYWLAIKVGSDAEMTPRQQIASAGYAFRAEDSAKLEGRDSSYYTNAENIDTGILPTTQGGTGISGSLIRVGSYTGTGGAQNVSHGLGALPSFGIIICNSTDETHAMWGSGMANFTGNQNQNYRNITVDAENLIFSTNGDPGAYNYRGRQYTFILFRAN